MGLLGTRRKEVNRNLLLSWVLMLPAVLPSWHTMDHQAYSFSYTDPDLGIAGQLDADVKKGISKIILFFGHPYPGKVKAYLFPNRTALNKQWETDWGIPAFKAECWMVASGVAARLDILSPNAWKKETCEHDAADKDEVASLVWHELVHVYHAQYSANPTFKNMDNLSWLVEGLATYASGQLSEVRMQRVQAIVREHNTPVALEDFWKGNDRYALAGSIVRYVDRTYGRVKMFELLEATDEKSALKILGVTENELIDGWKRSISG